MKSASLMLGLALLSPAAGGAFDYEVSARTAFWTSSLSLDNSSDLTSTQLWVRGRQSFDIGNATLKVYAEGWADVQTGQPSGHLSHRVRQAYAQLGVGSFDFRAGLQIFPWGRADGLNPTDHLTPRQYTFLTRDTDDQRFGTPALSATWFSGPLSVTGIWLAGFRSGVLPWPPAPFPPTRDLDPQDPQAQWAVRLESVQDRFEGSVSYFDGYSVQPTGAFLTGGTVPQLLLAHGRVRMAGADFAVPVDRLMIRGELARTSTESTPGDAVFTERSQFYAVVGGEHTFGNYLDVEAQYYFRHVYGMAPVESTGEAAAIGAQLAVTAQQFDRNSHGYTLRVADEWLHETLKVSLSGIVSTSRRGYLLQPLIKYQMTDELAGSLGGYLFRGDARSLYGLLSRDSTAFVELRWGF
jgi:hypothetical protein